MQSKILIVDDEPRICDGLKTLLCTQNYEVHTCCSGSAALDCLTKEEFDLVLLDISMGEMDGFQVIDRISHQNIDITIIIMTGNASIESAVKALRMGANDYLKKPFRSEELFSSVKNVLNQRELKRENELVTRKLNESEDKFRQIYNNILDVYYETSLDGIILEISPSIEKHSQYKREELIGKSFYDIFANSEDRDKLIEIINSKGMVRDYEIHINDKDGTQHICSMNIEIIKDDKENPIKLVGIFHDISERKQAEDEKEKLKAQLQQSHKMEAIGTLAAGIAHDFNNILSGILGYAQLVEININNPEKAKKHTGQIVKGAQRATELVRQILTSSRQTEPEKYPVKISLILKEALKLLRSAIPSTIEIRENFDSKAKILADPTRIHQVIMNLCTNAYYAMHKTGGILSVSLKETEVFEPDSIPGINILPGSYLKLEVSDTGPGMNPEVLKKIFEPYFTTKKVGEGTGLGLAFVLGIVEEHNGYIKADSELGKGSNFQVYFPVLNHQINSYPLENGENVLQRGTERIMVVDDDTGILTSTRELLEDSGYNVCAYSNGEDALKEFKKDPYQFDLIITDLTMPKMTGDELSVNILKIRDDLPIVLCTGYSENFTEDKALKLGIRKYVHKPVDSQSLFLLIREALDDAKS